ncbi:tyrosine--tRNA ligase [Luteolibacter soli]|uniref:Tyrosine--tRNA ligase n=1 Tax=Luteolibacter soli TaxID=3135280 RepID=A0ABU9B2F4_9BACT
MYVNQLEKPFLEELEARGLLKQRTAELVEPDFSAAERPTLYVGYDPSATSLHAGSLIPILTMDRFRRRGGQIIILLGGATGLIGDPSGKDLERKLENEASVLKRIGMLAAQLQGLFARTEGPEPIVVNNGDWYGGMPVLQFLRDIGKHFSVNQMLTRESVRSRLEDRDHGISFTEFSYQLFQGYDFLHLFQTYGCTIQMGASDQWGNIVSGVDLVRRVAGSTVHGLTLPLLTNSEGKKYGKSEKGAVWLDPELTSPYLFYQFWWNSTDDDAPRFLRWLTDYSEQEVEELAKGSPELRLPQKALADYLTARVHGAEQADLARRVSAVIFSDDFGQLSNDVVDVLASTVPTVRVSAAEPCLIAETLVLLKACKSKSEARRLITQGAVSVNGQKLSAAEEELAGYSAGRDALVVAVGKSRRFLVHFDQSTRHSSSR